MTCCFALPSYSLLQVSEELVPFSFTSSVPSFAGATSTVVMQEGEDCKKEESEEEEDEEMSDNNT